MSLTKFVLWNIVFIITDMVANVITRTPFTVRGILMEWFWWNVAFVIVLAVGFVGLHMSQRIVRTAKHVLKYLIRR